MTIRNLDKLFAPKSAVLIGASDRPGSVGTKMLEQVTHARKFMSAARSAARVKPAIVVKSGRHAEAAKPPNSTLARWPDRIMPLAPSKNE